MSSSWTDAASTEWQEVYRQRLMEADDAVKLVESGDRIWIPVGQQVGILVMALLGRMDELSDVEVSVLPMQDFGAYDEEIRKHIRFDVLFSTLFSRDAVIEGRADFTPWWVYGGHKALDEEREGARPVDVCFVSVTPPNRWGYCCFGNAIWDAPTTSRRAKKVVAVVTENLPWTYGDTTIHVSEVDAFVDYTQPMPEMAWAYPELTDDDRVVCDYIGELVRDGDTIQIGTGSTTGALPRSGVLERKTDLSYFGELTVPGTIELVQKGVITGKKLKSHPGKFVTATAGNTPDDLAFIDNNPAFEFYPVEYMHHPGIIGKNDNLVAINNALSVDLAGQVAATTIGPRVWSGTGGHLSYAMGAFLSNGGRYICVLPSTAVGGAQSRIVPTFEPGQIVTIPRDISDIVVTEYGVARLLNKTARQRAQELISVAHPDFRADLKKQASKLFGA